MAEYIKREEILRKMGKIAVDAWKMKLTARVETVWNEAQDVVKSIPAADVVERKTGKWIDKGFSHYGIPYNVKACSVCGYDHGNRKWWFCPNCGARMAIIEVNGELLK